MAIVNLYNIKVSGLAKKIVYSGIAEEMQSGTCKLWQTIGNSGEQRRRMCFYRVRKEIGKGSSEGKFLGGEQELGGCGGFSELLLGKEKIFLPAAMICKVSFFLLGCVK